MLREHALLLVAHGSARYPDAGRVVEAHAAALRAADMFAEVAVGLLHGGPTAAEALAALYASVVHVVPFFMEAGWFTQIAVPRALRLDRPVTERNGRVLRYAAPVGTHEGMADVIEARVRRLVDASRQAAAPLQTTSPLQVSARGIGVAEAGTAATDTAETGMAEGGMAETGAAATGMAGGGMAEGGMTKTGTAAIGLEGDDTSRDRATGRVVPALLVVGHGSAGAPGRVTALHGHVARLAATGRFPRVEAAFLEEPPFAAGAMARLRGAPLAVLGFFAGEGGHVRDDLPALVAAERAARSASAPPLLDCGSVGEEPAIRRIILDLVAATT